MFTRCKNNIPLPDSPICLKKCDFNGHLASVYALAGQSGQTSFYSVGGDGWIVKWESDGLKTDGILVGQTGAKLFSVAVDSNHNVLMTGDMFGHLYRIDLNNGTILSRIACHKGSIYDIYVWGETDMVTVSGDGYICLWELDKNLPVLSVRLSAKGLRCVVRDSARGHLWVGSSDNNIYVLDERNLNVIQVITGAHQNSVFALEVLPSGHIISGGRDAHMKIWDSSAFQLIKDIPAHWYTINKIKHIPEMNVIITASRDKTIRIWNDSTFEPISTEDFLKGGHLHSVNTLLWIPQTRLLCSAGDDKCVKGWSFNSLP